ADYDPRHRPNTTPWNDRLLEHRLTRPRSPQTNGVVERFNGRLCEVIASHHFRSAEDLETTTKRYVWLYNQHIGQKALNHRTPVQAMKDWYAERPDLFRKKPRNFGDVTIRQ
ncbi:MAG: transposase, partial [Spiribacter salinus]